MFQKSKITVPDFFKNLHLHAGQNNKGQNNMMVLCVEGDSIDEQLH